MMVEPSCPATPSGSGRCPARSQITSAVMNAAAMIRFAVLPVHAGMVLRSSGRWNPARSAPCAAGILGVSAGRLFLLSGAGEELEVACVVGGSASGWIDEFGDVLGGAAGQVG